MKLRMKLRKSLRIGKTDLSARLAGRREIEIVLEKIR